jgi:hypothetical protein
MFGIVVKAWENYLVAGAIDGTCHYRERIHPRQADFYRGDKHRHFLLASVVTVMCGLFTHIDLVQGHNNDQGTFL